MHKPKSLRFAAFGADALSRLPPTDQGNYLRCYLNDLGARWVIEEPHYFDRDFLDEFAAFYATSARGYKNACRRLLFFGPVRTTSVSATEALFDRAVGGDVNAWWRLSQAFLGFIVLRPLPSAPFGRTVLAWYPERRGAIRRVHPSARNYQVHVAGLEFDVKGLAWQQQDGAVGRCATIGVWSMLHSSAFDERLGIPTTAEITRGAHRAANGSRVFPSSGLANYQLLEAIKEQGLAPIILTPETADGSVDEDDIVEQHADSGYLVDARKLGCFREKRFNTSCASLLRSGFPVLVSGIRGGEGHVVCIVGFRPTEPSEVPTGHTALEDARIEHLYVHDDTLGPNVRFKVNLGPEGEVQLEPDTPPARRPRPAPSPTEAVDVFLPNELIVAVHDDVRVSPDRLHFAATKVAQELASLIEKIPPNSEVPRPGLGLSLRYMRLNAYLAEVLWKTLDRGTLLARTRRALCEKVAPMSLHLGVVRIGVRGDPMLDLLYDTTDTEPNLHAFAHVVFDTNTAFLLESLDAKVLRMGARVHAFNSPP